MGFRKYLQELEQLDQLAKIDARVNCELEVAALARHEFAKPDGGKALYFCNLPDKGQALAVNLFGNEKRLLRMLQSETLSEFSEKLKRSLQQKRSSYNRKLQLRKASFLKQDNSSDLTALPALRSWPQEIEPYLTLALAVSKSPEDGKTNLGLYRAQVKSSSVIALNFSSSSGLAQHHREAQKNNEKLPVALLLGAPPLYWWLGAAPLPEWADEFSLARELCSTGIELSGTPMYDLPMPHDVEVVIEGELAIDETCSEGPFGNHTGQYVTRNDCPMMQVQSIQLRDQAIIPATVVGPPPSENIYLGKANECLIRTLLQLEYPEIVDLTMPQSTIFHGAAIVKVKTASVAFKRDLIDALWQRSPLRRSRFILLVDPDIDLMSLEQCWWRGINGLHSNRIYTDAGRVAVDASGYDLTKLVTEDPAVARLIAERAADYKI